MQMQMATPNSLLGTHWAYMSQLEPGATPTTPGEFDPDENFLSQEWRWMRDTTWIITDKSLFGKRAKSGVFTVESYRNGYFWGSGESGKPFNVLGSVTPEGNVLLLVSKPGGEPVSRTGTIERDAGGGTMTLRSYEGKATSGVARTIDLSTEVYGAIARGLASTRHH